MKKKPEDIQNLDERLARFKKAEKQTAQKADKKDAFYAQTAAGWQIGIGLFSAVLIGSSLGYVLDSFFNTAPWLLVFMTICGGLAGILNVYRTFKDQEKNQE